MDSIYKSDSSVTKVSIIDIVELDIHSVERCTYIQVDID